MAIDFKTFWNGPVGEYWVEQQEVFDAVLAPIGKAAIDHAHFANGDKVIDLGCSSGTTSIEIAGLVGNAGEVLGLDISKPLLNAARRRAQSLHNVTFVEADAAEHPFANREFDVLYSRVGCMFFADPIKAFSNLRTGMRIGARIALACFREPGLNTYVSVPLQAALQHLPPRPAQGPDDPHMFSFANPDRVRRILTASGFAEIHLHPFDLEIDLAKGSGLDAAVRAASIGNQSLLIGQPEDVRARVESSIRQSLMPYVQSTRVPMRAAIWVITGQAL